MRPRTPAPICLLLFVVGLSRLASGQEPARTPAEFSGTEGPTSETLAGDVWSTTTLTHIEYAPFGGLVKIEIPTLPKPAREGGGPPASKARTATWSGTLLSVLLTYCGEETPPYRAQYGNILAVPFMSLVEFTGPFRELAKPVPSDGNPFEDEIDQPLFALFTDLRAALAPRSGRNKSDREEQIFRTRVLDSLVFCLFEGDEWDKSRPGFEYVEWFNLPMITTFSRENRRSFTEWHVLETPLTAGFAREEHGTTTETRVGDFLAVHLYERHRSAAGRYDRYAVLRVLDGIVTKGLFARERSGKDFDHWWLLGTPVATLAESERKPQSKHWTILEAPSLFGGHADWLTFALATGDVRENGKGLDILRLPLLGPVCRSLVGKDGRRSWHLFPQFNLLGN
jgi:hypothetical protein